MAPLMTSHQLEAQGPLIGDLKEMAVVKNFKMGFEQPIRLRLRLNVTRWFNDIYQFNKDNCPAVSSSDWRTMLLATDFWRRIDLFLCSAPS